MKALSICSLVLFIAISSVTFAQTEKGRLRIGGEFSGSYSKNESDIVNPPTSFTLESKEYSLTFSPVGGIFLADGFEVGLSPSIRSVSSSTDGNPNSTLTNENSSLFFSIGPYVNYYIGSGEKGKPFVGFKPEIGWGNSSQQLIDPFDGTQFTVETDSKLATLNLTAGYALFLNDAYMLSFYAGYTFSHTTHEQDWGYEADSKAGMFKLGVSVSTTFKR